MKTVSLAVAATLALLGCDKGQSTGGAGGGASSSSSSLSGSQGSGGAAQSSGSSGQGGQGSGGSCSINGQMVPAGSADPADPCQICAPQTSTTTWSPAPDGRGCGPGSQCQKGMCSLAAQGACDVHVPGDYAGVQEAITALRAANTKATVCVADGTYPGNLNLDYGTAELTILGSAASRVIFDGAVQNPLYLGSPALVRFRGITVTKGVVSSKSIAFEACVIQAAANGNALSLSEPDFNPGNNPTTVMIDGCDISASGGTAVNIGFSLAKCVGATPLVATIQNSYVHDAKVGVAFYVGGMCADGSVTAVNNTLSGNETGIRLTGQLQFPPTVFVNNVIVGSMLGITSERNPKNGAQVIDDFRQNALFGNTTNYGGLAAPGMGYVTMDPKLSSAKPPAPTAGSPLISAGDPALLPASDYYGIARKGRADIGAVEGP